MNSETMKKSLPKIAFFALESYSLVGGLQQFNRRVVSALSELSQKYNGTQPIVILKGDKPEHVKDGPEHVVFKACGQSRKAVVREVLAESTRADVMLLGHINLLPMALLAKCVHPSLKIVLFVHGDDVWNDPTYRSMKFWDPLILRFIDRIASVSEFTANRMAKEFGVPCEKFTIFPNAVDSLANINTSKDTVKKERPMLLTVARLAEHDGGKHHDSVLRAMPKILAQIPSTRYRIVGDGVLRPKLEALAEELNITHAVDFVGRISNDELARFYSEASLFVMPSEKEGFGIVFLEAWQRGIPVICGSEDASHEVITDGIDGFAIHHADIELLAEKILYILQNPEKAMEMGKAGQRKVQEKYLMTNFTQNLDQLIAELKE